jgi:signal transduction histidine kinase
VDREALQQALVNLVDNAVKHAPAGSEVVIGIELEPGPEAPRAVPRVVSLFVDDRGPGIPEDEHARIFEPFYRRGSEMRRETRGIGIGLSIVKHIAEAHGGRVVVRSTEGAGSRFAIELPVSPETAG